MIRNDELPSLTAVITSDLDLRDLYRNDFLTALEDVNAEVAYQIKQPEQDVDVTDVVQLMEQAHASISKWFDLIESADVEQAMEAVQNEKATKEPLVQYLVSCTADPFSVNSNTYTC